jgi:hypothetical protein
MNGAIDTGNASFAATINTGKRININSLPVSLNQQRVKNKLFRIYQWATVSINTSKSILSEVSLSVLPLSLTLETHWK